MPLTAFVRQALNAATGVPRLYAAALKGGLGPAGAAQVVLISSQALRVAAAKGAGEPGRQNAVRHFIWQSLLTSRFDRRLAQRIADEQESGTPNVKDSEVDRHNNAVGQEYGETHRDQYADLPTAQALERLAGVALEKWDDDELTWVR